MVVATRVKANLREQDIKGIKMYWWSYLKKAYFVHKYTRMFRRYRKKMFLLSGTHHSVPVAEARVHAADVSHLSLRF